MIDLGTGKPPAASRVVVAMSLHKCNMAAVGSPPVVQVLVDVMGVMITMLIAQALLGGEQDVQLQLQSRCSYLGREWGLISSLGQLWLRATALSSTCQRIFHQANIPGACEMA